MRLARKSVLVSGEENTQDNSGSKVGQNSNCHANGKDGPNTVSQLWKMGMGMKIRFWDG